MDPATQDSSAARIARAEKERLLAENQAALERDLWHGRLEYESMPRVVDMQFSNICNMSCTMCYDGENPPARQIPVELAERIAEQVFPTAAVLVPFSGSEPLIVTWDLTRRLAEQYGIELDIITNLQFLDEDMFRQIEPLVSSITFSIDSHLRDVFERIRLRSKPDKVFRNLPVAARLCREHGIEPQVNIVYMMENAAFMDETVAFFADAGITTVRLLAYIRMPHLSAERDFSDAAMHLSPEWNEWMLGKIRRVAEEKQIRVSFDLKEKETVDHLPKDLDFRPNDKSNPLQDRLRLYYPGYCWQSVDRFKVMALGDCYPCCMGDAGMLQLGDISKQSFAEIWNGPEARDLRRGMMTGDVPSLCRDCSFRTAWYLEPQRHLPLIDWLAETRGVALSDTFEEVSLREPAHMLRTPDAPTLRWSAPSVAVDRWLVVFAPGGEYHDENVVIEAPGDVTELAVPDEVWSAMRSNVAWWWSLVGVDTDGTSPARSEIRCLVRHEPVPRIEGSTLEYDGPQETGPRVMTDPERPPAS